MNNNEYMIINKTTIQKRIEELKSKRDIEHKKGHDKSALRYENTILELKQILSQSTPLIPELSKAYDAGKLDRELSFSFDNAKSRYLNSLKLKI
jgi:hypothetical protein